MALVEISHLHSGMVAATDVRSHSGRLLVSAGTVLSEQHLLALRTWGISSMEILHEQDELPECTADPADTAELEQAKEEILPRFRLNDTTHPIITELLRLAALRKVSCED